MTPDCISNPWMFQPHTVLLWGMVSPTLVRSHPQLVPQFQLSWRLLGPLPLITWLSCPTKGYWRINQREGFDAQQPRRQLQATKRGSEGASSNMRHGLVTVLSWRHLRNTTCCFCLKAGHISYEKGTLPALGKKRTFLSPETELTPEWTCTNKPTKIFPSHCPMTYCLSPKPSVLLHGCIVT